MWHFLYIIAFALLAFLAIGNLIRNLILLGSESRRPPQSKSYGGGQVGIGSRPVPHPELLDDEGNVIREPLLVMRSISVKDAREQLDALFEASDPDDSSDRTTDRDA
ncbi:MAG TPA: DUF2973 domain-containing protein [Trichocoleus sp.]